MTLVASILSTDSTPLMISDTLLTSKKIDKKPNNVTYPTLPRHSVEAEIKVVALSQKIIEILPNLFVGWSGDYDAAARFITNIKLFVKTNRVTYDLVVSESKVYFDLLHPVDKYSLSIIILCYEQGYYHQANMNSGLSGNHDPMGNVTVIGSGSKPFLDYLDKVPLHPVREHEGPYPPNVNRIQYCLSYIAQTLNFQKETGFGIKEGWGGGFELVLSKSGGELQKLDRVMYLTFVWWFEGEKIRTSWTGSRYFSYTIGNQLNIFSQERHKLLKRHVAVPPDCPMILGEQKLDIRQRTPQLACVNLTNRDTGKSRTILEYAEAGLPWCGLGVIAETGESIRANSDMVQKLIRLTASQDAI